MRYFKPGSNEGKSLYIPLPLEFMAKKAEQEQASIDAVKNTAGELYGQINFNAITEQQKFKDAKINEYLTKIDSLATELNQAPENWSTIATKLNSLAQEFSTDKDILSMENTYTAAATRLKDVRANGEQHNIWVDDFPLFLEQQKASDKLLSYDYKGSKKVLDWLTPTKTLMDDVSSTKTMKGKVYVDPEKSEYITKITKGGEYTTAAMVAQRALDITPILKEQLAFKDYFAKQAYEKLGLIDGADTYYTLLAEAHNKDENKESATIVKTALGLKEDRALTKDDMMNFDVYKYAYGIGTGKIKSSTTYDEDVTSIPEWQAKKYGLDTKKSVSTPGTKFDFTIAGDENSVKPSDFDNYQDTQYKTVRTSDGSHLEATGTTEKQFYEKWSDITKNRYETWAKANGIGGLFDLIVKYKGGTEEQKRLFKTEMKSITSDVQKNISESPMVDVLKDPDEIKDANFSYFKATSPTIADGLGAAANLSGYDPSTGTVYNTMSTLIDELKFDPKATITVVGDVNKLDHGMGWATSIDGAVNTKFADPIEVLISDPNKGNVTIYMQREKYESNDELGLAKRNAKDELFTLNSTYMLLKENKKTNVGIIAKNDNLKNLYIQKKDDKPVIIRGDVSVTGVNVEEAYQNLINKEYENSIKKKN